MVAWSWYAFAALCLAAAEPLAALKGRSGRELEVRVRQGRLRGEWRRTVSEGVQYASFRGIPYAESPLGPLRFKDPKPAGRWLGLLDATRFGNECIQMEGDKVRGDEDCLFLNVYVPPGAKASGPLPVLVFIPGGAFCRGSGNRYGADYFMEAGGAILVTINYRLGVFGFLHLGTSDVPGNAALKDQAMALRWVKDNIAAFGGNPQSVTIFGQSAGGVSVHAHVMSPFSTGLFHKAISISGSLLAPWALPRNPELQRRRLVQRAGCGDQGTRPEAVAACLRTMPAHELVRIAGAVSLMKEMLRDQQIPFCPVVDGGVPGAKAFIPDRPERMLATGNFNRVPYVVGVTSAEVIFFLEDAPVNTTQYLESGLKNITDYFQNRLKPLLPFDLPLNATSLARVTYKPRSRSGEDILETLVEASGDFFFVWPAVVSARLHSVFEPRQYLYYFDLDGAMDLRKPALMPSLRRIPGVPHGADMFYMFHTGEGTMPMENTSLEMRSLRSYVQLALNLAITGKPTPQPVGNVSWPTFDSDSDGAYLNFGDDYLSIRSGLRQKQMTVWDLLYMFVIRKRL